MNIQTDTHRNLAEALSPLSVGIAPDAKDDFERPPRRRRSRFLWFVALGCLLAGGGAAYWRYEDLAQVLPLSEARDWAQSLAAPETQGAAPKQEAPVATALTAPAAQAPAVSVPPRAAEITGSGYVMVRDYASVFAKYEGRITDIAVDLGDTVSIGQPLVELSDPGARFALDTALIEQELAQLALENGQIELSQSERDYERLQTLYSRGTVSETAREEAATALRLAQTALAQARQEARMADLKVQIAQEHVDNLTVRAPVAGKVTALRARVGNSVLARVDTIRDTDFLMEITDTSSMYIEAEVAETNVARLHVGLQGEARLDGFPDQPFGFRVAAISPVVSAEKGTITLRLAFSTPPEGIRPNMAARIRITLGES